MNESTTTTAIATRPDGGGGSLATVAATPGFVEAIEKMGDWFHLSEMFGCKKPQQGKMLALACAITGRDPFDLMSQYMIVEGRLTRRYDMMLSDLRRAGGDYDWIEDGEDGVRATIEITWRGKVKRFTYTMEMAKRAGVVKSGGAWVQRPGNMLRSKAVRNGLQMYAPEILGGVLTPEDAEEIAENESSTKPTAANRKQRAAELKELDRQDEPVVEAAIDAVVEPVAAPGVEATVAGESSAEPPFDADAKPEPPARASLSQLRKLISLCGPSNLNMSPERYEAGVMKSYNCIPGEMTEAQAAELIAKFEDVLAKKRSVGTAAAS